MLVLTEKKNNVAVTTMLKDLKKIIFKEPYLKSIKMDQYK